MAKPARNLTTAQLASELGVDTRRIRDYVAAGMPRTAGGPGRADTFSLDEARAWMAASGRTGRRGRPTAVQRAVLREEVEEEAPAAAPIAADGEDEPDEGAGDAPMPESLEELPQDLGTLSAAEIDRRTAIALLRKTHWQARQARALALETEGRLVDRDEISRQRVERIQAVRARHEVVPSRLGWKVVGKPKEEVERLLAEEMALIGEEFAKESVE